MATKMALDVALYNECAVGQSLSEAEHSSIDGHRRALLGALRQDYTALTLSESPDHFLCVCVHCNSVRPIAWVGVLFACCLAHVSCFGCVSDEQMMCHSLTAVLRAALQLPCHVPAKPLSSAFPLVVLADPTVGRRIQRAPRRCHPARRSQRPTRQNRRARASLLSPRRCPTTHPRLICTLILVRP